MKRILIFLMLLSVGGFAQSNRSTLGTDITNNIYTNGQNKITAAILQPLMLNQNNSYCNLLSDTNLLDVRLFSPYATYTPGMGAFYGDTLFMNIATAHGTWNSADWVKITSGCNCSTLVKYADTTGGTGLGNIVTLHYVTNNVVLWADTNTKIATYKYVAAHGGTNYLSDTVGGSGTKTTLLTKNSGLVNGGNKNGANVIFGTQDNNGVVFKINNIFAGEIDNGSGYCGLGYGVAGFTSGIISYTTGFGYLAGSNAGSGATYSTFLGSQANYHNTSGYNNTSAGAYSQFTNTTGAGNSSLGLYSLYKNTSNFNTAMGDSAGYTNTTGSWNQFYGWHDTGTSSTVTGEINFGNIAHTRLFILWGKAAYVKPIQISTATSGTVVADGSEVLRLTGAATNLTITMPSSPVNGQLFEISTNQASITLSFSSGATLDHAPTAVTYTTGLRFIYDSSTSSWGNL